MSFVWKFSPMPYKFKLAWYNVGYFDLFFIALNQPIMATKFWTQVIQIWDHCGWFLGLKNRILSLLSMLCFFNYRVLVTLRMMRVVIILLRKNNMYPVKLPTSSLIYTWAMPVIVMILLIRWLLSSWRKTSDSRCHPQLTRWRMLSRLMTGSACKRDLTR